MRGTDLNSAVKGVNDDFKCSGKWRGTAWRELERRVWRGPTFCLMGVSMSLASICLGSMEQGFQPLGGTTLNMGTPGCSWHTSLTNSTNGRLNSFTVGLSTRQYCRSGASMLIRLSTGRLLLPGQDTNVLVLPGCLLLPIPSCALIIMYRLSLPRLP